MHRTLALTLLLIAGCTSEITDAGSGGATDASFASDARASSDASLPIADAAPADAAVPPDASGPQTFRELVTSIPSLTHYYPLNDVHRAHDVFAHHDGATHGATYDSKGAIFSGSQYIEIPDGDDFSVKPNGQLMIVVFLTVNNWRQNTQGGEYVHWMGKGESGAQEWTFRYYPDNHPTRPRRVSFYHFNTSGGLGAGSYFQDNIPTGTEFMVAAKVDTTRTRIYRNGVLRDTDLLSGYNIKPTNTSSPVRIGTRDKTTGYLVGRVRRVAFFNATLSQSKLQELWAARNLPEE